MQVSLVLKIGKGVSYLKYLIKVRIDDKFAPKYQLIIFPLHIYWIPLFFVQIVIKSEVNVQEENELSQVSNFIIQLPIWKLRANR